jgi:hypothetical protein
MIGSGIKVILRLAPQQSESSWEGFIKYVMASGGMIYSLSFMMTASGILMILRLLPQ